MTRGSHSGGSCSPTTRFGRVRRWAERAALRAVRAGLDVVICTEATPHMDTLVRPSGAWLSGPGAGPTPREALDPRARYASQVSFPGQPARLPFLESISWFDADPYALTPREMLARYERGWRHVDVTASLGGEERAFVRALAATFGSALDVSA